MAYQEVLTALADPTRRQIFESLRSAPLSVGQIAVDAPVSRPAVSQHLKVLQTARLVRANPVGNRRLYAIDDQGLSELREYLDSFWKEALNAYKAEVARRVKNNKEE